jgi:hypothetical protein
MPYVMQYPFFVDDGELDNLTDQQIFVLGVEIGRIMCLIDNNISFQQIMFHSDNYDRLKKILDLCKVGYTLTLRDDWCEISVPPLLIDDYADGG